MGFRKNIKKFVKKSTGRGRSKSEEDVGRIPSYQGSSSQDDSSRQPPRQPTQQPNPNFIDSPRQDISSPPRPYSDEPAVFSEGSLLGDFRGQDTTRETSTAATESLPHSSNGRDSGFAGSTLRPDSRDKDPFHDNNETTETGACDDYSSYHSVSSLGDEALDVVPSIFPEPNGGSKMPEDGILSYMHERAGSRSSLSSNQEGAASVTRGNSTSSRRTQASSKYEVSSLRRSSPTLPLPEYVQRFNSQEYEKLIPDARTFLADDIAKSDPHAVVDSDQTTEMPVIHEWIYPNQVEQRDQVITREVHSHEVREVVQPVVEKVFAPPRHMVEQPDGTLLPANQQQDGSWAVGMN